MTGEVAEVLEQPGQVEVADESGPHVPGRGGPGSPTSVDGLELTIAAAAGMARG